MFFQRDLQILNKIQTKSPTVSLYLNTDQKRYKPEEIRTTFRDLLKRVEKLFDVNSMNKLRRRFRLRLTKNVRGLVFFTNPSENIFYDYELPQAVSNGIYIEKNLHLLPLAQMLDEYERYLVAVFDKSRAKIFSVYLGEIEDRKEIKSEFPGKHDMGGWSQARYQRHIENHLDLHLKNVAKIIDDFNRKYKFDRLILAGNIEAIPALKRILPKIIKDKVCGEFKTELFANDNKILGLAQKIEEKIERQKEKEKIGKWQKFLGRQDKSCSGFKNVIGAANQKKILELYLDLNTVKTGYKCYTCGCLDLLKKKNCPICSGKIEKVDLIDELAQTVINQNGKVEFVKNDKGLKKLGGIGAITRY